MNLVKEHWTEKDGELFESYLLSFSKGEKSAEFEKRIVNTNLECIAVPSAIVDKIIKEIYKGNFEEFINLWLWNNYTETSIIGKLISKIKNFDTLKKYLTIYANKADNWATCDCLKLKVQDKNKEEFYSYSLELLKSKKPFVKRVGLNIIMKLVNFKEFLPRIFNILNSYKMEEEYYVNMMVAWIVCECFAKHRNETLEFLKQHNLNKFTINKAISKCHDSFRVSKEDKEMLKSFRQN